MTPDPKPRKRVKATREEWQVLRWHKLMQGCRICGIRDRAEFHHLVGRDLGGDDVSDNLVPLCPIHHKQVEERQMVACSVLRDRLRGEEIAYVVGRKGEDFLSRYYPLISPARMDHLVP
jgi:HNH endonuclease